MNSAAGGAPVGGWVVSHGVDLVDTPRIERMIERHGERFLSRCFTAGERSYAESHNRRVEHYAARFAAKEAIFKAIGTGWSEGVAWIEAEVEHDALGKPFVRLSGRAAEVAAGLGIDAWSISLSHVAGFALASAIALRSEPAAEPVFG